MRLKHRGAGLVFAVATLVAVCAPAQAADHYALPQGAGSKDGSSWENALDASRGGLQKGWDALKPGETLWIGSGAYKAAAKGDIAIRPGSGGETGKPKRIAGKDTGGGLPVFTSTFDRANAAKTGVVFVSCNAAAPGAGDWTVQDIVLHNYRMGVTSRGGALSGVHVIHVDVTGCREGINIDGGGTKDTPTSGAHDIEIRDCAFQNYTKRGIRLTNGCHDIRVVGCTADAGGKAWATEPFHMGFQVGAGAAQDHDITFVGCTARNNYDDEGGRPDRYWNADGFCAESNTYNLHFRRCRSFDNTDGGWDCKTKNITLEDCVSLRNKRNYRMWGVATLTNCVSAYAIHYGGTGGSVGLWTAGTVTARNCTFHDNGIEVDATKKSAVTLERCIVSQDATHGGTLYKKEDEAVITTKETTDGSKTASAPLLHSPHPDWSGEGTDFDSTAAGMEQGYSSTRISKGG